MATLAEIVKAGKGTAGSNGAWRVHRHTADVNYDENYPDAPVYELWHYATQMLVWAELPNGARALIDYDTGHGSVSDQNGMNTAFRILGFNLYYSRAGGSRIA